MSVTRITRFTAREGSADALHAFLQGIVPIITASPGCNFCQILRNQEQPAEFVVIEVWASVGEHQASVKAIPPEKMLEAMSLLSAPPSGAYYSP